MVPLGHPVSPIYMKTISGFTLIELLVVVAVIGILATIVSTNYLQAIHKADAAACQQNLRIIYTAMQSYRMDFNRYPPADGIADSVSHPEQTAWGCGPAANGYWSGVSLLLSELEYCSSSAMYCPSLKRHYDHSIPAYSGCSDSNFSGRNVPQWRFLRYAYNNAAIDAGYTSGGEHDIESEESQNVWLLRCLHLDIGQFDPEREIQFPFKKDLDEEERQGNWYGEFELRLGGSIRFRPVKRVRH